MRNIENQPVSFSSNEAYYNAPDNCSADEIAYAQPVDNAEQTQFQLSIEPCEDAVQLIANSDFAIPDSDWTLGANWSFGTNRICAVAATGYTDSDTTFPVGYYKFTIIVDSISGGLLRIGLDSVQMIDITTEGTYNFYGYGTGMGYLRLQPIGVLDVCISSLTAYEMLTDTTVHLFEYLGEDEEPLLRGDFTPTSEAQYFNITQDRITVTINWAAFGFMDMCAFIVMIDPCTGAQLTSNMFKVGDFADQCTILINACNNNDSLGFVFVDSDFSPRFRIETQLAVSSYANEKNIYEDSAGDKAPYYYSRRKSKSFETGLLPEYLHDFLSTLGGYQNLYIDGVKYVVEDSEYEVNYPNGLQNFGFATIQVSEKIQDVKFILCDDSVNDCNLAE